MNTITEATAAVDNTAAGAAAAVAAAVVAAVAAAAAADAAAAAAEVADAAAEAAVAAVTAAAAWCDDISESQQTTENFQITTKVIKHFSHNDPAI